MEFIYLLKCGNKGRVGRTKDPVRMIDRDIVKEYPIDNRIVYIFQVNDYKKSENQLIKWLMIRVELIYASSTLLNVRSIGHIYDYMMKMSIDMYHIPKARKVSTMGVLRKIHMDREIVRVFTMAGIL